MQTVPMGRSKNDMWITKEVPNPDVLPELYRLSYSSETC